MATLKEGLKAMAETMPSMEFHKVLYEYMLYSDSHVFKSGIAMLDKKQDFKPGIYIIGGAPGIGKTSFLVQLAYNAMLNNFKVHYICYGHSINQVYLRLLSLAETQPLKDTSHLIFTDFPNITFSRDLPSPNAFPKLGQSDANEDGTLKTYNENTTPIIFLDSLDIAAKYDPSIMLKLREFVDTHAVPVFVSYTHALSQFAENVSVKSYENNDFISYADVIWGLQFSNLVEGKTEGGPHRVESFLQKTALPISNITLVSVKNRFGLRGFKIPMQFVKSFGLFKGTSYESTPSSLSFNNDSLF